MTSTTITLAVPRGATEVWAVLADFDGIVRWAPNVDHSCLTTTHDEGVGTVRRIQTGRTTVLERVVEWEPGRRLSYVIEGLPSVIRSVTNTWQLDDHGTSTTVSLTSTVDAGPRPPQKAVAKAVTRALAKASDQMLHGLDDHLRQVTA